MKISLFAPYGLLHREVGVMGLLSNFLSKSGAEVVLLRCDGAQRACARDAASVACRTPFSCAPCMQEQGAIAQWAGIKSKQLSSFLSPDDVGQVSAWLSGVKSDQLFRVEFRGASLWEPCREQFLQRWNLEGGQEISSDQEQNLRALFFSHVTTRIAAERYISVVKPSLHFVAGGDEAASQAYMLQAKQAGGDIAVFSYVQESESVIVRSSASESQYETKLVLEGITSMRSDPRTWAPEVTAIVHEMLSFLGYAPDRVV